MLKRKLAVSETSTLVEETSEEFADAVQTTEDRIEGVVTPVRKSIIKRFPILFLLLVTMGVTATITGMEQLLLQSNFLQSNPIVVLIIGLALLVLAGTLYKKLG